MAGLFGIPPAGGLAARTLLTARPRIFVSYHHHGDQWCYNEFVRIFDDAYDVIEDRSLSVGNREKLRALAVTTRVRAEMLPDVPTMAEAALPAYEMPAWRSIMGPAGMSSEVVQILNRAIARSLESADLRERFSKAGSIPMASSPEELRKRYEDWIAIFGKIAKDAGIQPH